MSENGENGVSEGDGYAVGSLGSLGGDYGFKKIRRELGVTAFGVNAIVLPAGYDTGGHYHDEQEELYFVHRGTIEMSFGDDSKHELGEGGLARVDPATVRSVRNVGDGNAVYVVIGGKDGYVDATATYRTVLRPTGAPFPPRRARRSVEGPHQVPDL